MADNNSRCINYTTGPYARARGWLLFPVFAFAIWLISGASLAQSSLEHEIMRSADIQFFGDVFIDSKFLAEIKGEPTPLGVSPDLLNLLNSSLHNIVNFEGVATNQRIKFGDKTFHLRMPGEVAGRLASLGVSAATMANNHSMDFGLFGLMESLIHLHRAGIHTVGADLNATMASAPLIIDTPTRSICVFSFAKTYPKSTWATDRFAGTANPTPQDIDTKIKACKAQGMSSIAVFHWGRELERTPQGYQRDLAHACIDAGAIAVIGHHPHLLQEVEVYKGVPIFYSIGNFLFSSYPMHSSQEGMAVRLVFDQTETPAFDLIQLQVNNRLVKFRTRLLSANEPARLDEMLKSQGSSCVKRSSPGSWTCRFSH